MEQLTNCPQCPRHCPADALSCGRGKAFFAGKQGSDDRSHHDHDHEHRERGPHGRPDKNTLEGLLMICGHHLHHGGASSLSFAALSANDQEELKVLLTKLVDNYPKVILTLDEDPEADYDGIRRINALEWLVGKTE